MHIESQGKSFWDKDIHLFECQPTVAVVMGPVSITSSITNN